MTFDVLILSTKKDFNKLPYVIDNITHKISGINQIFIISPEKISISGVNNVLDDDALILNESTRNSWYKI